jgi:cell division protein FtsZ
MCGGEMELAFNLDDSFEQEARIKVIGIGGGGGNAINRMITEALNGVQFIAVNTDHQALEMNGASNKLQIGRNITRGLGAGANPNVGRQALLEEESDLRSIVRDCDMIFITAGMGGGTGTGAAPEIARIAREEGALTVAIVTKPFLFEGKQRMDRAEEGIAQLREQVDTLLVIPNQRLMGVVEKNTSLFDAFRLADNVLHQAVKGIADMITIHGMINLDFADVRTVMSEVGGALMGVGVSSGEHRALEAAQKAISSPLLDDISIRGASGVLINITGGDDLTLYDVQDATNVIYETTGNDANIIFGTVVDPSLGDEVRVTVIATGIKETEAPEVIDLKQGTISRPVSRIPEKQTELFNSVPVSRSTEVVEKRPEQDYRIRKETVRESTEDLQIPTFLRRQMD